MEHIVLKLLIYISIGLESDSYISLAYCSLFQSINWSNKLLKSADFCLVPVKFNEQNKNRWLCFDSTVLASKEECFYL